MTPQLKEMDVSLSQLLLDPNNPRFVCDSLSAKERIALDPANPSVQESLLKRFSGGATNPSDDDGDEETTNIQDLRASMLRIGYVPIDKIVVRKLTGSDHYAVVPMMKFTRMEPKSFFHVLNNISPARFSRIRLQRKCMLTDLTAFDVAMVKSISVRRVSGATVVDTGKSYISWCF